MRDSQRQTDSGETERQTQEEEAIEEGGRQRGTEG